MKRAIPYWEKGSDWSQHGFFVKRVGSKLPVEATEIPRSTLPFFLVMDVRFLPLVNCKVLRLAALRTIEAHRRACW